MAADDLTSRGRMHSINKCIGASQWFLRLCASAKLKTSNSSGDKCLPTTLSTKAQLSVAKCPLYQKYSLVHELSSVHSTCRAPILPAFAFFVHGAMCCGQPNRKQAVPESAWQLQLKTTRGPGGHPNCCPLPLLLLCRRGCCGRGCGLAQMYACTHTQVCSACTHTHTTHTLTHTLAHTYLHTHITHTHTRTNTHLPSQALPTTSLALEPSPLPPSPV